MDLTSTKNLAVALMQEHGLSGWTFRFDHAFRRFGTCNNRKRVITLSRKIVLLSNESQVRNTILHEIAHALTPGQNHNAVWRAKALEIGCDGKRCYGDEVTTPVPKYRLFCPNCNIEVPRYRRHRKVKLACLACCNRYNGGRVSKKYLMQYSAASQTTYKELQTW